MDTDWQASDHTLGGRISIARETASLSSAQVARRLGIKSETLRNWETDRSEPRANRLTMLAGVLNVSPGWLLSGTGEGPPVGEVSDHDVAALQMLLNSARREQQTLADTLDRLEAKISHLAHRIDQGQWAPETAPVD